MKSVRFPMASVGFCAVLALLVPSVGSLQAATLDLTLSPEMASSAQVVDLEVLELLCGPPEPIYPASTDPVPPIVPTVCRTQVDPPPPSGRAVDQPGLAVLSASQIAIDLGAVDPQSGTLEALLMQFQLFGGQVIPTHCGAWAFEVSLRSSEVVPTTLHLHSEVGGLRTLSGLLDVPLSIRYVNLENLNEVYLDQDVLFHWSATGTVVSGNAPERGKSEGLYFQTEGDTGFRGLEKLCWKVRAKQLPSGI